jgi:hypothetical protein
VKALVERHEGRVVDTAGDSVFGEFPSVVNAVRCARALQQGQAHRNQSLPREQRIETRIGVHLGDVIVEDYRVYGDGVNIAARLEQIADPGGICISEAVYQQVHNKIELEFEDLGVKSLKNIEHPIRLYRITPERLPELVRAPERLPAARRRRERPGEDELDELPKRVVWIEELARTRSLVPLVVGTVLVASPLLLVPSAGLLPALGAVLIGIILGGASGRRSGRRGGRLLGLGAGLLLGAILTHWSSLTNGMFVVAGLIVGAVGLAARLRSR